jgi:hypothetical protein
MHYALIQSLLEYVCSFFSSYPANFGDEVVECCDVGIDVAIFQVEAYEPVVCLLFLVGVCECVFEALFEVAPNGFVVLRVRTCWTI